MAQVVFARGGKLSAFWRPREPHSNLTRDLGSKYGFEFVEQSVGGRALRPGYPVGIPLSVSPFVLNGRCCPESASL